ncbi:MAG TPA: retroviral-like aspartic protease family protein [Anaerolineae bacterium]|nr:retroviral-like aspartic protease family protein [Anaerolineae bacterium]
MTTRYLDLNYVLPMPALTVSIGRVGERPWLGPIEAVVDTGADMTVLPLPLIRRVKAHPVGKGRLRGPWGDAHPVVFFLVELQIQDLRLPGTQVAGDEAGREIILGRNILNKLPLFLDGPQQQTDLLDDATANRLRERRKQA